MDTKQALTLLGLDGNATLEQAKIMYRTRVKQWHPDRFDHDPGLHRAAEAAMKEINQAYAALCRVLPKSGLPREGAAGTEEAGLETSKTGSASPPCQAKAPGAQPWWARLFQEYGRLRQPWKHSKGPARPSANPSTRPARQPVKVKPCFEEAFHKARAGSRSGEDRCQVRDPGQVLGKPSVRKGCGRDYRDYLTMKHCMIPRTRHRDASPGPIQAVRPVSRITGVGGGR
ncbi:MAG: DnaJ domain-containing protein [Pseudomonadota bacterium]